MQCDVGFHRDGSDCVLNVCHCNSTIGIAVIGEECVEHGTEQTWANSPSVQTV